MPSAGLPHDEQMLHHLTTDFYVLLGYEPVKQIMGDLCGPPPWSSSSATSCIVPARK
jgi:hypothetical protein